MAAAAVAARVVDEVTSALDPEVVDEVLGLIRDGRVLEEGPPEQVLADPVEPRTRQFLRRLVDAGRL